jgi:hypothetical protein
MTIEQADIVRSEWGKFLEHENNILMRLFLGKIPESTLPYPKDIIKDAIDTICNHPDINPELINVLNGTVPILETYIDDDQALDNAISMFSNEDYRKAAIGGLRKRWDSGPW